MAWWTISQNHKKGISINKAKKDTKTHPLDKGSRFAVLP